MNKDRIAVGLLFSDTGVTSVVERTQKKAVLLAIEEINANSGAHGLKIEPIAYDPASDPRRYESLAFQLLNEDGVRFVFGCYMSSTRKAIMPLVEQYSALLFYPTLYEGFEYSESCIYSGATPGQNSLFLANYLMQNFGDHVYLVGSNYVFPYESNRIIRDFIQSRNGKILEEKYVSLNPDKNEIDYIISDILEKNPSFVVSTIVGDGIKLFYETYKHRGLDASVVPIGSLTTCEPEIAAMDAGVAAGHFTAAPYFETVQTPENRKFLAAYRSRFGARARVSACTEAAYFQAHMFAEACRKAGSLDVGAVRDALGGSSFRAPQGLVQIDPHTHHTSLWPRIGRVSPDGSFEIVHDASASVRPDPYLIAADDDAWSMLGGALTQA